MDCWKITQSEELHSEELGEPEKILSQSSKIQEKNSDTKGLFEWLLWITKFIMYLKPDW